MVSLQKNKRTELKRVIVETPALLNLVKHCRDAQSLSQTPQGILMGVMKEGTGEEGDSLLVTQTMPKANKAQMNNLLKSLETETQRLMDTNEIGFYTSSRMGLSFTRDSLSQLLETSIKFKNAVFLVYDSAKANFGMNPLRAYRLSERALEAFNQSHGQIEMKIVQKRLLELDLKTEDIFDEIPVRIQRNHMQQAYLFDFIRPEMPAFNTNVFKLAQPSYFESFVHQAAEVTDQFVGGEQQRLDHAFKAYMKVRKNQLPSAQFRRAMHNAAEEDASANKIDYLLLSKQIDSLCSQVEECGVHAPELTQ